MIDKELLLTIEIPNYVRKIKISDSRRAKYWLKSKVLAGKQKLPKKYLISAGFGMQMVNSGETNPIIQVINKKTSTIENYRLKPGICYWKEHKLTKGKSEFRLTDDATDEYIIKNTQVAGTESWHVINSQGLTNHTISPFTNGKVVKALHEQVTEAINKQWMGFEPKITFFPIRILMELHDYIVDDISKGKDWDIQNRCDVWSKAFVDTLTELEIIPDDHRAYVTQPPVPLFVPLSIGEPKLIFKIYADRRPSLESLAFYRKDKKIKTNTKQSSRKR